MTHYWLIRVRDVRTYIKTDAKYIPAMVVDIAVRQKMFCEVFVPLVEEVREISKEEYLEHMWE